MNENQASINSALSTLIAIFNNHRPVLTRILWTRFLPWTGILSVIFGLWFFGIFAFEQFLHFPPSVERAIDPDVLQGITVNFIFYLLLIIPLISMLTGLMKSMALGSTENITEDELSRFTIRGLLQSFMQIIRGILVLLLITVVFLLAVAPGYLLEMHWLTLLVGIAFIFLIWPVTTYAWFASFTTDRHYNNGYFNAWVENLDLGFSRFNTIWLPGLIAFLLIIAGNYLFFLPGAITPWLWNFTGGAFTFVLLYVFLQLIVTIVYSALFMLILMICGLMYHKLTAELEQLPYAEKISSILKAG